MSILNTFKYILNLLARHSPVAVPSRLTLLSQSFPKNFLPSMYCCTRLAAMTKYILISGGVVSGIGKGVIGMDLLQSF